MREGVLGGKRVLLSSEGVLQDHDSRVPAQNTGEMRRSLPTALAALRDSAHPPAPDCVSTESGPLSAHPPPASLAPQGPLPLGLVAGLTAAAAAFPGQCRLLCAASASNASLFYTASVQGHTQQKVLHGTYETQQRARAGMGSASCHVRVLEDSEVYGARSL